jgi:murein DD-endopeptidase MepM/ murein hydrolase activator NlpD
MARVTPSDPLVEGGRVYLRIPVKNFGGTASPAIHTYTEGYTAKGSLWRADGAQPTAVVIQPNQSVTFQVQHDLWVGHAGTWSTYGVYLWNDATSTYYGALAANGYDQTISFNVAAQADIRQNGPIQVSGTSAEGNQVYLTFPVKNFGGVATPAIHPYVEGHTALGNLWRADGAQPTAVVIQPGQSVTFQVRQDLWAGQAGTWNSYGVYVWNDSTNGYYGPLAPNGYSQSISFVVAAGAQLRQDGPIEVSGSLVSGGRVYLKIPVKNAGGTASPPIHTYTEGYTGHQALWRADGAQPTATVIQPGARVVFQVQHDLWNGHEGTWNTYGVFLWNDASHSYFGPLPANGNNQQVSFNVQAATQFVLRLPFTHASSENGLDRIWSFFDHEYPLGSGYEPGTVAATTLKYNGDRLPGTLSSCKPGSSCYSGHDGYDFGYRLILGSPVLAAHAGYAAATRWNCVDNDQSIYVVTVTQGRYRTAYLHLQNDSFWWDFHDNPRQVGAGIQIGTVGNTGARACITGPHLHFGVYYDVNNNGTFRPVDPYGFDPTKTDPWVKDMGGPISNWLWEFAKPGQADVSPAGPAVTITSGDAAVTVLSSAVSVPATLALMSVPVDNAGSTGNVAGQERNATLAVNTIAIGSAFQLSGVHDDGSPVGNLATPATITKEYSDADRAYADELTIGVYVWQEANASWQLLATQLDVTNNRVTATTDRSGTYCLRAQPLNPAPTLVAILPARVPVNTTTTISLVGTNYLPGVGVNLGIGAVDVVRLSATELRVTVPAQLTPGAYDVIVRNPDGQSVSMDRGLMIGHSVYLPAIACGR